MRFICAEVFRWTLGCCTNGDSKWANKVMVECEDGPYTREEAERTGYPLMRMKDRVIGPDTYYRLEPVSNPDRKWFMMGGNFAYTSDSRFPFKYPLPIHDRTEG